jgi:hypothetical protein
MATRARIGVELKDGKILTSYVHYDGYLAGLGYNLVSNWMNYDKVLEAIQLGDASTWAQTVGVKHPFSYLEAYVSLDNNNTMTKEEYNDAYDHMNTYYGRDRGESDVGPQTFDNEYDYLINGNPAGEEFNYLFKSAPAFGPGEGCEWLYVKRGPGMMHKGFQLARYDAAKEHHKMQKRVEELRLQGAFVG